MLGWMRGFVKSPWALVLFALLIVSFGVFSSQDPFQGVTGGGFVTVGDREVHSRDLNREVEMRLERIRQEQNQIISVKEAAQRGITQQALQSLIQRANVLAYADKIGVKASGSAVTNYLTSIPDLKDPLGRLDMAKVQQLASDRKITVDRFQDEIRDEMTLQYVVDAAFGGLTTPEVLMKPLLGYFGEQRTLTVARLMRDAVAEPKEPTPEELKAFYEKNKESLRQPERRRISVLSYSPKDYLDKVQVTEEQVKAEFDRRIKEFSGPETREIIQFSGKDRATVQTFIDTVKQGNTLEQAVTKTPGIDRVDLTVKPGDITDEEYNKGVFAMPANDLRGPQKVGESWYAVQVKAIVPGAPRPIAEVSETIRNQLRENAANKMFNDSEESFYDMAGGTSLEDIGKNIGAPTIELAPVDNRGTTRNRLPSGLLAEHADAFRSLFTLASGQMTDVIEGEKQDPATGGKYPTRTIFRVDEIIGSSVPPLEEVQAEVRNGFMAEKVREAADKSANDVVAAVKAGTALAKAAPAQKMSVLPAVVVNRAQQQPTISPAVVEGAFKLKQGEIAVVKGEGGEPWVVQIDKVEPISAETAAMVKAQLGQQITQSLQNDMQEVFIRGVQAEVQPKTNEKAIQAYFDSLTKDETQ
jgi:peptidyl-prolyl cis-trans isomerase D